MKKILSFIAIAIFFTSCSIFSPYGKKVTINDKLEIYIKGDSTTEADAKKLGTYLAETWKETTNQKSFQLKKESNDYQVRMVVDEEKIKTDSTLDVSFMALRMLIEEQVFKGSKVKLILTNNKFKDLKTFDDKNDKQEEATTTSQTPTNDSATKK